MRLAMCLFKFFPYGGLERDFLKIAAVCLKRGHSVTVFVMEWSGEVPEGLTVKLLKANHWRNHSRTRSFINKLDNELHDNKFDLVVGFNKMPGLDVYYAADVCYVDRMQGFSKVLSRLGGRYRYYALCEKSVFSEESKTISLMISKDQMKRFQKHYKTPDERMILLPPGISKDRMVTAKASDIRREFRRRYNISEDEKLLLMIGSGFKTKGLDRALKAIVLLPNELKRKVRLFVVGEDRIEVFAKMAKKLGIKKHVKFLGGRNDVPEFLLGADLLLQPSYHENTGTAIIEAIVSGLPVLASDVCGYSAHIEQANAGRLIPSPFCVKQFAVLIEEMLTSPERDAWKANALQYAKTEDLYSMPEQAVKYLEEIRESNERCNAN